MEQRSTSSNKIQLLSQALSAAISSLNLAKQLINEIEQAGGSFEVPGLVGKYNGMFMVTAAGKKYPVPDNYAAKTKLVYGDKLKMVEGPEGRRFKYISRVPFVEVGAVLAMKDGQFVAVSPEGSYKLLQSAVRYYQGGEGDKVRILLPRDEKHAPFAAVAEIVGKEPEGKKVEREAEKPAKEGEEGKKLGEREASAKEEQGKKEEKKSKKASTAKSAEAPSRVEGTNGEGKKAVKKEPVKKPVAKEKSPAKPKAASGGKLPAKKVAAGKKVVSAKKGELKIEPPSEEDLV